MSERFDLFGEPVSEGHGERGRPEFGKTAEVSQRVAVLLAIGWPNWRIAKAIGISQPTLRKHFFAELKQRALAEDQLKARRFGLLFQQMEKGNVGAHREFDRLYERERMILGEEKLKCSSPAKVSKVGKKEQQKAEAEAAHNDEGWGHLIGDATSGSRQTH